MVAKTNLEDQGGVACLIFTKPITCFFPELIIPYLHLDM